MACAGAKGERSAMRGRRLKRPTMCAPTPNYTTHNTKQITANKALLESLRDRKGSTKQKTQEKQRPTNYGQTHNRDKQTDLDGKEADARTFADNEAEPGALAAEPMDKPERPRPPSSKSIFDFSATYTH